MATVMQPNPQSASPSPRRKSKNSSKNEEKHKNELATTEIPEECELIPTEDIPVEASLVFHEPSVTQYQLQEYAEFLNKIKSLRLALEIDLLACDAKWTLFVSAAFSYRYDAVLQPFPPRFATEQLGYDIDSLVSVIKDVPKLRILLQTLMEETYEELSCDVIELLYWVLIVNSNPSLRFVEEEELNSLLITIDEKSLKSKPTHVFEIVDSEGFHSERVFNTRTKNLPLKLAFMGDKLDIYYSMLQNGFCPTATNKNVLELSTDLLTSLQQSPFCAAWGASQCGSIISCTAICEFALNTEEDSIITNENDNSCVDIRLFSSKNIRLRYLIFYGRRLPRNALQKRRFFSWIYNYRFSLSLLSHILLLVTIALANSKKGEIFKNFISDKFERIVDFFRRFLTRKPSSEYF